ncbi:MAG: ApaG protein [Paraglaciecola sp.]|jgi:ApaG protein
MIQPSPPLSPQIKIDVLTQYLKNRLPQEDSKYAFAYKIAIHNNSREQVQLINRYWLITDANGKKTEVSGPGVIGQQPVIEAGKSYQYTSGAILDTPVGTMQGHYEMQGSDGHLFQAAIDVFSLAVPNVIN